jgi:shikimate dehydrogenase
VAPAAALTAAVRAARLGGDARLLAVLGDPIAHSLSPRIQRAALVAAALPHRYVAVRCDTAGLPALFAALRSDLDGQAVLGLNLTAPLKQAALPLLDELAPAAAAIGAVNTIVRRGPRLVGHNTDAEGFTRSLATAPGLDPGAKAALVLGAGGAARAVCAGLLAAGAAAVAVAARRGEEALRLAADLARLGAVTTVAWERPALAAAGPRDLVVNATTLGLAAEPGSAAWRAATETFTALPWAAWAPPAGGAAAVDLLYRPAHTAFQAAAAASGRATANGLAMLVEQAAAAFELWTGRPAPREAMAAAARG